MGQRLGRVDALARAGVVPITPDEGIQWFLRAIGDPSFAGTVIVTSRFGESSTLALPKPDLPHLRFLLGPRVHVPGVELVSDVEISMGTDPYLQDHQIQETPVFPAVMGLEAMAQLATALTGRSEVPYFEDVEFVRSITVPPTGERTIRIAGLVQGGDRVRVVVRSDETSFQTDHFRAVCCFSSRPESKVSLQLDEAAAEDIGVDPKRDLYGGLLFHGERFQRVSGYQRLTAWECEAVLSAGNGESWFSSYHPGECLLGDPGRRDAGIHALQACVPHSTILPIGIERMIPKLRIAQPAAVSGRWVLPLLVTYLERRLEELLGGRHFTVSLISEAGASRRSRSDEAIRKTVGPEVEIHRRPDGKPDVIPEMSVSVSHAGGLTLAVAGQDPLACDMECQRLRTPQVWRELLGAEGFQLAQLIAKETGEALDLSATRVWTALECLKKAGKFIKSPLRYTQSQPNGWVLLGAGQGTVATYSAEIREAENPLLIAFLSGGE
jgi:enediyne polyketide synthase